VILSAQSTAGLESTMEGDGKDEGLEGGQVPTRADL